MLNIEKCEKKDRNKNQEKRLIRLEQADKNFYVFFFIIIIIIFIFYALQVEYVYATATFTMFTLRCKDSVWQEYY